MDDFSIYGDSFDQCLYHLELLLELCTEKNLTLNWEKYHFMVQHGIVLGYEISRKEIEDRGHSQAFHTQMCERYSIFHRTCRISL